MSFNKFASNPKLEMDVDAFATISGIRGVQFGKEIYSSMLKFKDFSKFLEAFPNVQRNINKGQVRSIANYILDQNKIINGKDMRFFSGITVTCRGHIFYNELNNQIAIDTSTPLSINDGQHRVYGVRRAISQVGDMIITSKDAEERLKLERVKKEIEDMVVTVTIFSGIDESQEKQLFHDLNNLLRRPSRSANIRLSQTDIYSTMAKTLAEENKMLQKYGVETDKQMISKNNENTFLLTTIYLSIKELYKTEIRADRNFFNHENFDEYKKEIDRTFTSILCRLPEDMNAKNKYIIDRSYTLRGICRYVHWTTSYLKEKEPNISKEKLERIIYKTIQTADWSIGKHWEDWGAMYSDHPSKISFSSSTAGARGVFLYLKDIQANQVY